VHDIELDGHEKLAIDRDARRGAGRVGPPLRPVVTGRVGARSQTHHQGVILDPRWAVDSPGPLLADLAHRAPTHPTLLADELFS
jgi:hypothetical protein